MPKDKKGGLALLIAGKPAEEEPVEDDYEGEDVPTDEPEAEAEPYDEAAAYPEFDIPDGLDLSDLEEGDEKEVLAVVRKKGDGACIVSVDGVDLAGGGAEEVPAPPEAPPPPTAAPPSPMDIRGRAMGAGLM